MASRPHIVTFVQLTDTPEGGANTETVAGTLSGVVSEFPSQTVVITGTLAFTAPAAITSLTVRCRRDALTGTQVGEDDANTVEVAANKLTVVPFTFVDARGGEFAGNYVITFAGAGEGGPGACNMIAALCSVQ